MGKRPTARSYSRQPVRQRTGMSPVSRSHRVRRRKSLSFYLLLKFAFQLFRRHTAVLWLVVGALLVGTISAAVMTIVDPTASVLPQAPTQSPVTAQAPVQPAVETDQDRTIDQSPSRISPSLNQQPTSSEPRRSRSSQSRAPQSASPLSAGSLLMLSCAGGCFLLSQWLKPTKPHPSLHRTTKQKSAASSNKQPAGPEMPSVRTETNSSADALPEPIIGAGQEISPIALSDDQVDRNLRQATSKIPNSEIPEAEPAIQATIVPAHQDHPLDWDEPSLADNLDLRQRRPLSYWL